MTHPSGEMRKVRAPKPRNRAICRMRAGPVQLRYEPAALAVEQADAFAALAAEGILAVRKFLGLRAHRAPLRIEVREDGRISAARGRTIRLPGQRVRSGTAPYLHEIVHVLAPGRHAPPWFTEGLACYVECAVAERGGGYDSRLFTASGNAGVDPDAARWLGDERGRAVLPFVGTRGMPRRIVEDRHGVATPFYVLSHALVKFLVERCGMATVARLARARRFAAAVRRETGRPMPEWRAAWLESLRLAGR